MHLVPTFIDCEALVRSIPAVRHERQLALRHRNWTEFCALKLKVRTESPHDVIEAWPSRDKNQYWSPHPAQEVKMLHAAIESVHRETAEFRR